ncbi:hypothetical protein D3C86_1095480 [compost metagenome]
MQIQVIFAAVDEAALAVIRRLAAKTRVAVEHGQQRQTDAAFTRSLADAQGQFSRIGVRLTIAVVVHVMKFSDGGITGLEHFDVQLTGNHAELIRADFSDEPIHQVAPRPETVVRIAGHFSQTRHRPLEGVGVQIRHARQQRAAQPFGAVCGGIGLNLGQQAIGADLKTYIVGPSVRQQRAFGKEGGHGSAPHRVLFVYTYTDVCLPGKLRQASNPIQTTKD